MHKNKLFGDQSRVLIAFEGEFLYSITIDIDFKD